MNESLKAKVIDAEGKVLRQLKWDPPVTDPSTSLPSTRLPSDRRRAGGAGHSAVLIAEYFRVWQFRARKGQAQAQTRGEVSGGGRKPWKQKGTGRARQGSIRSPLWRGGGVAHGPRSRNYDLRFNRKALKKVWWAAWASKFGESDRGFVLDQPASAAFTKTKQASSLIKKFGWQSRPVLLVTAQTSLRRAFGNLANLTWVKPQNLSPYQIFKSQALLTDEESLKFLEKKFDPS